MRFTLGLHHHVCIEQRGFTRLDFVSLIGNTEPFETHNRRDGNIKRTEEDERSGKGPSVAASAKINIRLATTP